MPSSLGLKLILTPGIIAAVTYAGKRWGALVAGWLSAFPVISGPILLFLALEHGPAFAGNAALGTLSGVLAFVTFYLAYAWSATRFAWPVSLGLALLAYTLSALLLLAWFPPLGIGLPLILAVLWFSPGMFPTTSPKASAVVSHPHELVYRMVAAVVLVLAVTWASSTIGPRASGIAATFPVMGSILAVFSHRKQGTGYVVRLLRGMVFGLYSFAAFCIALSRMLPGLPMAEAFLLSLAVAVLAQGIAWRLLKP
ncbi:hypothetical protein [Desulfoluna spongiiphila]|uniref:Uncharacterized protein n=1 Tax=Desulfoluna spongiiphila TaxID=419481 RepID=A0A1G5DYK8_9BACT|nr:hypothetical protein [Desulfoluna spongiiphila]SCY19745.1 hypothetical protein SAMN05216233_10567 [Desulfoluna spongiiphila]VVS91492.1 hypothetical protein DBB_10600 [Desulfoluna spongiiphila]